MGSTTAYVYNNVMFASPNVGTGGNMVFEPEGGGGSCGKIYAYNNTMENSVLPMANVYANHLGTNNIDTVVLYNNHYMTAGGYVSGPVATIRSYTTDATNISLKDSGYTEANRMLRPQAPPQPLERGRNLTSSCSTAPGLAALCRDTTLGGTRASVARPERDRGMLVLTSSLGQHRLRQRRRTSMFLPIS